MGPGKCVCCGEPVPEGLQVCPSCLKKYGAGAEAVETAEQLRDIAAVLGITAGTDANIKEAMQGILNIAQRLEKMEGNANV